MKKILILASNPRKDLNLEREIRDLKKVIYRQAKESRFQVEIELAVRPEDLQELFLEHEPLIVHYSGHGTGKEGLVLENDTGREQLISTQTLCDILALFKEQVQCVLLNACYSEVQAEAIIEHINYVIGMSQAIRDDAAIAFATGFYQALAKGKSIDESFQQGCVAIQIKIPEKHPVQCVHSEEPDQLEGSNIVPVVPLAEYLKPVLKKKAEIVYVPKEKFVMNSTMSSSDLLEAVQGEIYRKRYREQAREIWDDFGQAPSRVQPLTQQEYRYRQALLYRVKESWIKGFLENSLHTNALIEFEVKNRPDAVQGAFDDVPVELDESFEELQDTAIYSEMGTGKTLLILGEPGTGKTITLLKIAQRLVARSEQDLSQPIPVVFTLSSWINKQKTIAEWLVEELNNRYKVPPSLGKILIEREELILLLDGLDEVSEKHRDACVRALNQFIETHGVTDIVVCSRVREYEALSERLKLSSAICIQPLTPEQVYEYLDEAGNQLIHLKTLLQQDKELEEFASNPLILSVMSLAYKGFTEEELCGLLSSPEHRYKRLFETYIKRMFKRGKKVKDYPESQTRKWLKWLAEGMLKTSQTIFFIEQLQPNWLKNKIQINLFYRISVLLMTAFMSGIIAIPISLILGILDQLSGMENGIIIVLILGVLRGLIVGLIFGIILALSRLEIKPVESIKWSWIEAKKGLRVGVIFGVISGIFFGLQGIFILSNPVTANAIGQYQVIGVQMMFLIIIFSNFSYGTLIYCMSRGFRGPEIETRIFPNQGMWKSAKSAVLLGLLGSLLVGLPAGFIVAPILALMTGQNVGLATILPGLLGGGLYGLFIGMIFGGLAACIQHLTLRFILYFNKYVPWNYARFLNYTANCLFLQKVGGGYVFVHRMLLEHFAQIEPD